MPGYYRNGFGTCSPGPVRNCRYYIPVTDAIAQPECKTCNKGF